MALPAILGLAKLGTIIGALFTNGIAAVVAWLSQRGIWNVLYLAAMMVLLVGFVTFMNAQIDIVLTSLAGFDLGWFVYGILPDNTAAILSIGLSAEAARWVYDQTQAAVDRKFH